MNQPILSELADYLLAHREDIIGEWVRAVERDAVITSSSHLEYKELVDHIPVLFEDLAKLLKSRRSDPNHSEVARDARIHGKYRWRQGYRLEEVIREASIVRRVLFHSWVEAFAQKVPAFAGETRKAAEHIIHDAVDDVVTDSAKQFVEEQQKSINNLNSELADAVAEVRQQKATAEAANEAKDRFLAMLSHELRTPLNPILLWTHATLEEGQLDPSLRDGLQMVRRNIELEASLIDDLLDVARITGGKLQLHLQLSDAASLFRDALGMVKAEFAPKQLKVHVELNAANHHVIVDRGRIQQVFWNVLKNAQKFTADGGTISTRSFNKGQERLLFEITDSGEGIKPELLPKIFEAFEQGEAPADGLGLGLAISKGIIEAHGGSIHASSEGIGTGATFTIELKTAPNESTPPPTTLSP